MISGIIGLFVLLLGGLVAVALFAFWIWMLIHAITNKGLSDTEKIVWVLVIIFPDLFLRRPAEGRVTSWLSRL